MRTRKAKLIIIDKAKNTQTKEIIMHLVDDAYRKKIKNIKEAYPHMLPGDTITIVYAVFKNKTELVDSFEVDYTFPESRLMTENSVKENGTNFDRIITFTDNKYKLTREQLQSLYESTKDGEIVAMNKGDIVQAVEIYFYSNYLSNLPHVAKKNVITINSDKEGYRP